MTETGYQIWLFVFGFMGDPAGHENTRAKSRELLATPLTRHRSGECTSVAKSRAFQSSLALVQNVWANEMKKSLSAASASTLRCALLIGVVRFVVSSYSPCSSPGLVWKYMCDMRERTTWRRCYPRLIHPKSSSRRYGPAPCLRRLSKAMRTWPRQGRIRVRFPNGDRVINSWMNSPSSHSPWRVARERDFTPTDWLAGENTRESEYAPTEKCYCTWMHQDARQGLSQQARPQSVDQSRIHN